MWSPNELLKIEKQRDILSYITLQFFHFKKVPLEHCPFGRRFLYAADGGNNEKALSLFFVDRFLAGIYTVHSKRCVPFVTKQ